MTNGQENVFLRLGYALRELKQTKQSTLILGAGCSLASTSRDISTRGIMIECLREHNVADAESYRWEQLYESFINIVWEGKAKKEQEILLRKKLDDVEPTEGHKNLRFLVEQGFFQHIITTNFDLLLEKSFDGLSYKKRVGDDDYIVIGKDPKFNLLKVHGDLEHGNFRFAPSELMRLPDSLQEDVSQKTDGIVVFIGYRGQDIGLMNAISTADDYAVYWVDRYEIDRDDPFRTSQVFSFMNRRQSRNNFLSGKEFGDFDSLLSKLKNFLFSPDTSTLIKSKETHLNKWWTNTSIIELISVYGRLYELFLDLLKVTHSVQRKLRWKVDFPSYSKSYEDLLYSYLLFFNSKRLPSELLHIPNNEIDALILGIAIEIKVRTIGNGIAFNDFKSLMKTELQESNVSSDILNDSFWIAIEKIVDPAIEFSDRVRLEMQNKLSVESEDIPLTEFHELLSVVGFLSLLAPVRKLDNSRIDTKYRIRRLLQGNFERIQLDPSRLNIELGPINIDDVKLLVNNYLEDLPSISRKEFIEESGKSYLILDSKWLYIKLELGKALEGQAEIPGNLDELISKRAAESTQAFLQLGYVFDIPTDRHVQLKLDLDLVRFMESEFSAMFIVGSSGSGKTKALQNLLLNYEKHIEVETIVVSPKNTFIDEYGIQAFLKFPVENHEILLKQISNSLEVRNKKLILIFDGLNEIVGSIELQKNHYLKLLTLADLIYRLETRNIQLIISCRENAYHQYKNVTYTQLNPLHFFTGQRVLPESLSRDSSYQVQIPDEKEVKELIEAYFNSNTKRVFGINDPYSSIFFKQSEIELKTPFFVALAAETLNDLTEEEIFRNLDSIYDQFSKTMLDRLGEADMHLARKIIYAYFDLIIESHTIDLEITKFKLLDQLAQDYHNQYVLVINKMTDLNIFIRDHSNLERIAFQHDKIEEFFFKEYIEEFEYQGFDFYQKVVGLIDQNVIYQKGLIQYLFGLLTKKKLNAFKYLTSNFFKDHNILLPQIVVQTLFQSKDLEGHLAYLLNPDDLEESQRMINVLIRGIEMVLLDFTATSMMSNLINQLLEIKLGNIVTKEHQAYLYYFQSKIYYYANDYQNAQNAIEKSLEVLGDSNRLLSSKLSIHFAVIVMELGYSRQCIEILENPYETEMNGDFNTLTEIGIELGRALNHSGIIDKTLGIYDTLLGNELNIKDPYVLARIYEQKANTLNKIMFEKLQYGFVPKSSISDKDLLEIDNLFEQSLTLYDESMRLLLDLNAIFTYGGVVPEKIITYISYSYSIGPRGISECKSMIEELDHLFQQISTPYITDFLISKSYYHEFLGDYDLAYSLIETAIEKAKLLRIKNKEAKCHEHKSRFIYRKALKLASHSNEDVNEGLDSLKRATSYYEQYTLKENIFLKSAYELEANLQKLLN